MKKFLIIQTAFIGDVILATPIIENVYQSFPDAQIDFLVRKGNEGLLKEHPYLHQVLLWDKTSGKYRHLAKLLLEIRKNRYDVVINVQRFASTGLLTVLSSAKKTIGFTKNPFAFLFSHTVDHVIDTHQPVHETKRNLRLAQAIAKPLPANMKLYPTTSNRSNTAGLKKKTYICIAPASVWFTKQLPAPQWADLIASVEAHLTVYLIGGSQDVALCEAIRKQSRHPGVIVLAGKLSLLDTASLMQDALISYTNDSAPLHLASAVDAPVVAVFCSTVPAFGFGPVSTRAFVVETKEHLDCRPCGLHGKKACPKGHFKCALTIERENLLKPLIEVLHERAN